MTKQRSNFTLGLTVVIILGTAFAVALFIGARQPWGESTRLLTVRFAHTLAVPTLKTGAAITFVGQSVGSIRSMWLSPAEYKDEKTGTTRKMLFLYVQGDVQKRVDLRADCSIVPEGPILGGAGTLRIEDHGKSDRPLGPDQVVEGKGMGGFAAVTDQLNDIGDLVARELDANQPNSLMAMIRTQLDASKSDGMVAKIVKSLGDLNAITASVRDQLDPTKEKVLLHKLHLTLDHINGITGELRNQMDPNSRTAVLGKVEVALDTLNQSLENVNGILSENRTAIRSTMENVKATSETLNNGIVKSIAGQLDPARPDSLMAKVHGAIDRMGQSLTDLNRVTATTGEVVALNKDNLNSILANFKETSDHMKAATKDLRRNPWRLLYRPTLEETKELNIFDAARAFSEAATRLDDSTSRLKALLDSKGGTIPSDDPQLKTIRAEIQKTFEKFNEAEAALWKNLNIRP